MNALFKGEISPVQLAEMFENNERCLEFLAELKWHKGFHCRKCGNANYCAGKEPFSRRCTKCKTKETATNGTIFHNLKFPINKAFYIAYKVCKGKEEISTYEFARRLSLRQMTCWKFKSKITDALKQMESLSSNERSSIERLLTCQDF